uniref:uncharacterized protein LOC101313407 isoform X2 n=1 Tax=Fragaria vesca subsp. vesca TaxID=101020 RepID=UPI0005CA0557|nr:PREDICTED: uncharacterized protein LOC101313407 isoform X2 [Fragaria vesca subsp. vesca]
MREGGHGVCDGHECESHIGTGGLYFVCVDCFDDPNKEESFNLCTSCYRRGKYAHRHNNFLDNFVLLCSKFVRKSTAQLAIVPQTQIDPMMEKIRSTAFAYYENLSSDNKQKALEFIREMNIDGVSWAISLQQYENKFGSSSRMKKCFEVVDRNRDGWLDFPEFVTLYYLHKSGRLRVRCDGHGCDEAPFLKGAFFVCVDCFKKHIHFYLCTFCYRYGKYTHSRRHTNFEDNCMLPQDMILPPYSPDQTQAAVPSQPAATQNYQGALVVATQSVSLLGNIISIGATVGGFIGCNIL